MSKQNKTGIGNTIVSKEEFQSMVREKLPSFWLWVVATFVVLGAVNVAVALYLQRLDTMILAFLPATIGAVYAIYMHRDSKRLK